MNNAQKAERVKIEIASLRGTIAAADATLGATVETLRGIRFGRYTGSEVEDREVGARTAAANEVRSDLLRAMEALRGLEERVREVETRPVPGATLVVYDEKGNERGRFGPCPGFAVSDDGDRLSAAVGPDGYELIARRVDGHAWEFATEEQRHRAFALEHLDGMQILRGHRFHGFSIKVFAQE